MTNTPEPPIYAPQEEHDREANLRWARDLALIAKMLRKKAKGWGAAYPIHGDSVRADFNIAANYVENAGKKLAAALDNRTPESGSALLTDMRMQVKWDTMAHMPIPLYERMKAVISSMGTLAPEQTNLGGRTDLSSGGVPARSEISVVDDPELLKLMRESIKEALIDAAEEGQFSERDVEHCGRGILHSIRSRLCKPSPRPDFNAAVKALDCLPKNTTNGEKVMEVLFAAGIKWN